VAATGSAGCAKALEADDLSALDWLMLRLLV
jgi:hypothetical protein